MLLAAGLGERMRPLTLRMAKPALPVLDEPIVHRLARALAVQGIESLVVNLHAHPASVRRALADAPVPVHFSLEPRRLGSGGGIGAARHWLRDAPFLVLNADMLLELDLEALCRSHRRSGALATLALRDEPRKIEFGTIGYDEEGSVRRITDLVDRGGETGSGLFIGAQIMQPAIFDHFPRSPDFEVFPDLYKPLLEQGVEISSWLQPASSRWCPIGSPRELLDVNLQARAGLEAAGARGSQRARGASLGGAWLGQGSRLEPGARVSADSVIGAGSRVPSGWELESCLWLPGASPRETGGPRSLRRAIAFADEVWIDG
ncbi:MAG: sugar phosphate nucleotidyltransferase [Myxococcota bacterium]